MVNKVQNIGDFVDQKQFERDAICCLKNAIQCVKSGQISCPISLGVMLRGLKFAALKNPIFEPDKSKYSDPREYFLDDVGFEVSTMIEDGFSGIWTNNEVLNEVSGDGDELERLETISEVKRKKMRELEEKVFPFLGRLKASNPYEAPCNIDAWNEYLDAERANATSSEGAQS